MKSSKFFLVCLATAVWTFQTGCVTGYHPVGNSSAYGGYTEEHIGEDVWRIGYLASTRTTDETVQTYWLYRCAELALENGKEGFQIISDVELTFWEAPEELLAGDSAAKLRTPVFYVPFFMPMVIGPNAYPYRIIGSIKLLDGPIEERPPKVYDALRLKARLAPWVRGEKCAKNVCPHERDYLEPGYAS